MKKTLYYLLLLVFVAVCSGFLISQNPEAMSMQLRLILSALLLAYVVAIYLGERTKPGVIDGAAPLPDQPSTTSIALITAMGVLVLGILYQLFVSHSLDYWLPASLIVINLSKIISLIYLNNKKTVSELPKTENPLP